MALLTPLLTKWHENRSEAARANEAINEKLPHEARCALETYMFTLARIAVRIQELDEAVSQIPDDCTPEWARSQATRAGQLDALVRARSRYSKLYHTAAYFWGPSKKRRVSKLLERRIAAMLPELPECIKPAKGVLADVLAAGVVAAATVGVAAADGATTADAQADAMEL